MDTQEFFQRIQMAIEERPELAKSIDKKYLFKIEGDVDWVVDLTADPATISTSGTDSHDCLLIAAKDDFEIAINNPRAILKFIMDGRIRLSNTAHFQEFMKLYRV